MDVRRILYTCMMGTWTDRLIGGGRLASRPVVSAVSSVSIATQAGQSSTAPHIVNSSLYTRSRTRK